MWFYSKVEFASFVSNTDKEIVQFNETQPVLSHPKFGFQAKSESIGYILLIIVNYSSLIKLKNKTLAEGQ